LLGVPLAQVGDAVTVDTVSFFIKWAEAWSLDRRRQERERLGQDQLANLSWSPFGGGGLVGLELQLQCWELLGARPVVVFTMARHSPTTRRLPDHPPPPARGLNTTVATIQVAQTSFKRTHQPPPAMTDHSGDFGEDEKVEEKSESD
jgi:hypothetical protein